MTTSSIHKELFTTFMKIGGFTLGGGAAMIPLMQQEIVTRHAWLSKEEFLDILAVSQATPGIFAVDMASHIGYKIGGVRAGIWAALGVITPSLFIILLIAIVFSRFRDNVWVEAVFRGIRPAVVALLTVPVVTMARSARLTRRNVWIPITSTLLIFVAGITPALVIICAALLGYHQGRRHR